MHDPQRYKPYLDLVSGRRRGVRAAALRALLRAASGPYAAAVSLRSAAFNCRLRRITRVDAPVISVGNLTTGGTGKTPLVEYVARWLRARQVRVAILSRGYGAPPLTEDRPARTGNDETDLLARNLPDVPQLVGRRRVRSARVAIDELGVQCLVLDDGFQHRRLARDLDLVTIDALNPFGFGHLLPRGLLREPLRSLRRADVVALTRCDQAGDLEPLRSRLARVAPGVPLIESRHAPVNLIGADGGNEAVEWLRGRRVLAVCGIGNPDSFRLTLLAAGAEPADFLVFPDHHGYTPDDRRAIYRAVRRAGAEAVLTTQKDLAKLVPDGEPPRATWAVRIQLEVTEGREILEARLRQIVDRIGMKQNGREPTRQRRGQHEPQDRA